MTLRDLVRQALRMRPDRLVVGEVRGAEVVDLLAALNTGHEGGCGTVHANSRASTSRPGWRRSPPVAGLARDALHSQLPSALRVVVHLARAERPAGGRGLRAAARAGDLVVAVAGLDLGRSRESPCSQPGGFAALTALL